MLGKRLETIITILTEAKDLIHHLKSKIISSIIQVSDKLLLLLVEEGVNNNNLSRLNVKMKEVDENIELKHNSFKSPMKANVALASVLHLMEAFK
jgi:hypothetical protein